jgi:hypothetical protein
MLLPNAWNDSKLLIEAILSVWSASIPRKPHKEELDAKLQELHNLDSVKLWELLYDLAPELVYDMFSTPQGNWDGDPSY